ncbi:MAG: lytic transglycosylase domain-containing protein [Armatimonadota bacterium]
MINDIAKIWQRVQEIEVRFEARLPGQPSGTLAPAGFDQYLAQASSGHSNESPYDQAITEASRRYGVDELLVRAVIRAESNFNPRAVSRMGAVGLMQLMPGTARALGVSDPFDPEMNVDGGVRYLRQQLDRFGDVALALAAYNAGPGAVERYGGVPPYPETQRYIQRVLSYLREYQGQVDTNSRER